MNEIAPITDSPVILYSAKDSRIVVASLPPTINPIIGIFDETIAYEIAFALRGDYRTIDIDSPDSPYAITVLLDYYPGNAVTPEDVAYGLGYVIDPDFGIIGFGDETVAFLRKR